MLTQCALQQPLAPGLEQVARADAETPHIKYANQASSVGKQNLSTKRTTPSFTFSGRGNTNVHITEVGRAGCGHSIPALTGAR